MSANSPVNPYIVLAVSVVLPGVGHVLLGQSQRGLMFAFFALVLAVVIWHTTTLDHSFIGRTAGGLFIWAISSPDAHEIARTNYERWRRGQA